MYSPALNIYSESTKLKVMKTLSIVFYIIGSILLIISCFTVSVSATWWFGGSAVVALVLGCIMQYNANRHTTIHGY